MGRFFFNIFSNQRTIFIAVILILCGFTHKQIPIKSTSRIVDSHFYKFNLHRWDLDILKDDGVSGPFGMLEENLIGFISRCGTITILKREKHDLTMVQQKQLPFEKEILCNFGDSKKLSGVKDMLIDKLAEDKYLVYITYLTDKKCPRIRLDKIEMNLNKKLNFGVRTTLFQTKKCPKPPIILTQSGGALANTKNTIYFTIGNFGYANYPDRPEFSSIYSINKAGPLNLKKLANGVRNSEGIDAISKREPASKFLIFTDMGPKGGDEVNILKLNHLKVKIPFLNTVTNFGSPHSTYGTDYGHDTSSDSKPILNNHLYGIKPQFVYVPAIAPTAIKYYDKNLFINWGGSAFLTSLRATTIFRIHFESNNVVYSEPIINTGERMRFLQVSGQGIIYAKADPNILFSIEKDLTTSSFNANLFIKTQKCLSCHKGKNSSVPSITNLSKQEIIFKLTAFSNGQKNSPIMNNLTKNLSQFQIEAIANELSKYFN